MDLIIIILLALSLRVIFFLTYSSDDDVHLWNIKSRKKIGNPWQHSVDDSVIEGKRGYPVLAHYIVSLFPEKHWRFFGKMLNIVYDLAVVALVYLASAPVFRLFPRADPGSSLTPQAMIALLVATSPILMPTSARVRSMGGRTLGLLISLVYFISMGFVLIQKSPIAFLTCVISGILVILSSQFAFQNLVFSSLLLSILHISFFPVLILFLIGGISWVFPQIGIRDIFRFKYEHARWYRRNWKKVTQINDRNSLTDLLKLPITLFKDFGRFLTVFFYKSSWITAVISLPALIVSSFLFVFKGGFSEFYAGGILRYVMQIAICSVIIFIMTSARPFLYLGQAERYFEYSVPFLSFLFVAQILHYELNEAWFYYIMFVQIIIVLLNFIVSSRARMIEALRDELPDDLDEVSSFLEKSGPLKILTIPTKLAFRLSYFSKEKLKFYYRAINAEEGGLSYLDRDWAWFELPRDNLLHFKQAYGIDTVVMAKDMLDFSRERGISYPLEELKIVFENDGYLIFHL